jgi:hypothetical protein
LRVSSLVEGKEDRTGIARQEDGFQRWLGQHPNTHFGMRSLKTLENLLLRITKLEMLY